MGYFLDLPFANKCMDLSYRVGLNQYDKGFDDIYVVMLWFIAFTFLRGAIMRYIFHPLADMLNISPAGKKERFAEQGWAFLYYVVFWSVGMVKNNNNRYTND